MIGLQLCNVVTKECAHYYITRNYTHEFNFWLNIFSKIACARQ